MKKNDSILKTLIRFFGVILILLAILYLCYWGGLFLLVQYDQKTQIETIQLENKQTIKLWYETDIQHPLHHVRYKITQGSKVIVPATSITYGGPYGKLDEYKFQVAFAQDKTLVCVYDRKETELMILYNTQTGQSWPNVSNLELWRDAYAQLMEENPDLPKVDYLMMDNE